MAFTIDNPTYEEFLTLKISGDFRPEFSFEDYLAICQERRETREEARRLGYLDGYVEPPELTEEDEAILDRIWARQREEKEAERVRKVA